MFRSFLASSFLHPKITNQRIIITWYAEIVVGDLAAAELVSAVLVYAVYLLQMQLMSNPSPISSFPTQLTLYTLSPIFHRCVRQQCNAQRVQHQRSVIFTHHLSSSAFIASVKYDGSLSCRRSLTSVKKLTVADVQKRGGEECLRCPPARFLLTVRTREGFRYKLSFYSER